MKKRGGKYMINVGELQKKGSMKDNRKSNDKEWVRIKLENCR